MICIGAASFALGGAGAPLPNRSYLTALVNHNVLAVAGEGNANKDLRVVLCGPTHVKDIAALLAFFETCCNFRDN